MISLCILTRDAPHLNKLIDMFDRKSKFDFEVCIGDNSTKEEYQEQAENLADEYIKITDKELFRGGIPQAHNRIANECANSYKIVYLDSDEYPIWVNPDLDSMLEWIYVMPAVRGDFFSMEEIEDIDKQDLDYYTLLEIINEKEVSTHDRIYNCRYTKFSGLCHSIFHVPMNFRGKEAGAILFHNKTIRDSKNKERMDMLIHEQYYRQNINPYLASSEEVLKWGKKVRKHNFENWKEWDEAY